MERNLNRTRPSIESYTPQNQKLSENEGVKDRTWCHHPFGMNSESSGDNTQTKHFPAASANFGNLSKSGASASIGENLLLAPLPPRVSST